jgi:Wzt C-terminal domain/Sulfotransferase family
MTTPASPEGRIQASRICFIHVPKTAGTSAIALMRRHLGPGNLYHAENRYTPFVARLIRRYRFVAGHFFLRDFAADAFRDTYVFTILRDPVEQVISQYRYFRQVQGLADDRDVLLAKQSNLAEILRSPKWENNSRWINAMTTCFSGEGVHKIADRESLRKAKHHLRLLDLVGLQESFAETYSRLAEDLGWKKSTLVYHNQTEPDPATENLKPGLRDLIEARNPLDRELYEEARVLFASRHSPPPNREQLLKIEGMPMESGTKEVFFERIELVGSNSENQIQLGAAITLRFHIRSRINCPNLTLGIAIKDQTGLQIYGTNSWLQGKRLSIARYEAIEIEITMESPPAEGWYSLVTALHPGRDSCQYCYQWLEEGLRFCVVVRQKVDFIGVANLHARFSVAHPLPVYLSAPRVARLRLSPWIATSNRGSANSSSVTKCTSARPASSSASPAG